MIELLVIVQIFMLVNPLTSLPLLIQAYKQKFDMKEIGYKSVLLAFGVALFFVIFGNVIFQIFNISVTSLRIAGGIIIFLLGLEMTREKESVDKEITQHDAVISILATPMLTGPATISYIILTTLEKGVLPVMVNLSLSFVLVAAVFIGMALLIPRVNVKYISFVSKVLGLFLAALGVEMVLMGIKAAALF
jgi:multiple antibiotic resistance protein